MKFGKCSDCSRYTLLTKHSMIGGHKIGNGWVYLCEPCHQKRHNAESKRENKRYQRGSNGKFAKGTRRRK